MTFQRITIYPAVCTGKSCIRGLRFRPRNTVFLVTLIALLEGAPTPLQAKDTSDTVTEKLGLHTYAIHRDMIEMIYRPNYSKHPNPNPNWSREPVIRLAVQWPDFAAVQKTRIIETVARRITISLSSLEDHPIQSVDDLVKSLDEKNLRPRIIAAEFGMQELLSDLSKDMHYYIATTDDQKRFFIRCEDENDARKRAGFRYFACDSRFALGDLNVDVYFTTIILPEWKELFAKVRGLVSMMQRE